MLSIVPIKSAGVARDYYEHDNYYAKNSIEEREASEWWGKTATDLQFSGTVDLNDFETSLKGVLPNGITLGIKKKGGHFEHRSGYDLTFSAPKSVSILAEIGNDTRLHEAHTAAVKKALSYIEKHAITSRVMHKGQIYFEQSNNIAVSLFRHGTSRTVNDLSAPDPDTHTHAVIHNYTRTADGKIRSISSELLFHHKMVGGMIYRAELALRVQNLGYEIKKVRDDGLFEVKEFSREQIEHFSKRHLQIKQSMNQAGVTSYKASKIASTSTRMGKTHHEKADLDLVWQAECKTMGLDLDQMITQAKSRTKTHNHQLKAEEYLKQAISHLSERKAVFHQRDLIKSALALGVGQLGVDDVLVGMESLVKDDHLVSLHSEQWTTREALNLEQDNINRMQAMRGKTHAILTVVDANDYVDTVQFSSGNKTIQLTSDQKKAVACALSTSDQIVCFNGKPGVGKTVMLSAIKMAGGDNGYSLLGLSAQAKAAYKIEEESGITSKTVSKFLAEHERRMARGIKLGDEKRLIIIDEASMLSSQQVNRFLKVIDDLGPETHVILQGDVNQLPSVDAGSPFAQFLKHNVTQVHLNEIRRQKNASLKSAVEDTLQLNIESAINNIGASNTHQEENKQNRLQNVADEYLNSSRSVRSRTLVLIPANEDRIAVNELIRSGLKNEGSLSGLERQTTVLVSRGLTSAALTDVFQYKQDDSIRFNKNFRKHGIQAGDYYSVQSVDYHAGVLTLVNQKGKIVHWDCKKDGDNKDAALEVYYSESRSLMKGDIIRWTRIVDHKNHCVTAETAKVVKVTDDEITLKLANKKHYKLDVSQQNYRHWDYAFSSTVHSAQGQTANYVIAHLDSSRPNLATQSLFYVAISRAEYGASIHVDDLEQVKRCIESQTGINVNALDVLGETTWKIMPYSQAKTLAQNQISSNQTLSPSTSVVTNTVNINQPSIPRATAVQVSAVSANHKTYDIKQIFALLQKNAQALILEILGEPNRQLSTATQLRYGRKGSLAISLKSGEEGLWYDHESQSKGNIYQLVRDKLNLNDKEVIEFTAHRFGLAPAANVSVKIPSVQMSSQVLSPKDTNPNGSDLKAIKHAQKLYGQASSIQRTVAERYLREHRGIELKNFPAMLKFHPGIKPRGENKTYPALLIPATKGRQLLGVQAIFLDSETGQKANIANSKLTYGRLRFGATAIINKGRSTNKPVLVFEGPEDALSALKVYSNRAIQAVFSASNLKNAQLNKGDSVVLCTDNDGVNAASTKAVATAISHHIAQGHKVACVIPPNVKEDYNDILKIHGEEALKVLIDNAQSIKARAQDIAHEIVEHEPSLHSTKTMKKEIEAVEIEI